MLMMSRLPDASVEDHINIFLKAPSSIYVGHIASAATLLYIASQNPVVPVWFLYGWAVLELVGYPVMMEVWARLYKNSKPETRNYHRWIFMMDVLCAIVGASWGTMMFVSLHPENAVNFAIQMSIAAGATAAAVRSLAIFPRSFTVYAIPFLGLLAMRLFMLGGNFVLLGGLVLIFLFMLLRSGKDVMESVSQFIAIRNENLDLAERFRGAAAEAEHANREKTRLLAAASHDLRQPIHAIGLHLETLPIDQMEKENKQTLTRIRNSLQTLSKLFNSLLDVSLLDSGKIQVRPTVFDLRELLDAVLEDYEPLAEIAHVTLVLECPRNGVLGDAILIRRMVQNLVSNAIRHSHGGLVRIVVEREGDRLAIQVADDGPGIAKEHQAAIFEEFTQIVRMPTRAHKLEHNDDDDDQKGLGLGLAIVRRLADLMELKLDMDSDSTGTRMWIKGLQKADLADISGDVGNPSQRIGAMFRQKHILVADDDAETLEATAGLLQKWGCQVYKASNIDEIHGLQNKPDLVISDYSFGDRYTGLDIIVTARQTYGDELKALIVSGDSSDLVQKKVEDADLLLIHKPVQPVQLRSAMLDAFLSS